MVFHQLVQADVLANRVKVRPLFIYVTTMLFVWPVTAQDNFPTREQEDESLSVQFGVFQQTDGSGNQGGNPFVDEEMTVYEAIVVLDKKINETDSIQYQGLVDLLSSASIKRETNPQFQVLQSHPSGNERGEIGLGWKRKGQTYDIGVNGSLSAEFSSYYSAGMGINFSRAIAEDNARLRFAYQAYYDTFEFKLFNGIETEDDQRNTHTIDVGWTQNLSPDSIMDLSLSHTTQTGFLGTTWYSVFVNGLEVSERMPETRYRNAFTVRYRKGLSVLSAYEIAYRYYDDSWDLSSRTLELKYSQYIKNRSILLEPRIRLYDQKSVDFFGQSFDEFKTYMTSDPDLGEFRGRSIGLKSSFYNVTQFGDKKDISVSADFYRRSDGVDFFWTTIGYIKRF